LGSKISCNRLKGYENLYFVTLKRDIDPTGLQAWTQALADGLSRAAVALAILGSAESDRLEVTALYGQFLHRQPDPTGMSFFVAALQAGFPNELAGAAMANSREYLASV
jgi:hypothetical protein